MRHVLFTSCLALFVMTAVHRAAWAETPSPPAPPAPPTAESLALKMLDSEALYTLAGGLKPISEGFWQLRFPEGQETHSDVEAARTALAALPLGADFEAGVYLFAQPLGGKRSASAFVAHQPSLRALIERRQDVFKPLGVTGVTPAKQVLEAIDRATSSARWRAFGLVFGYPEYAVEFFVAAGESQAITGKFVERDFLNLPTFASDRGRFVYAVPKGHLERDEDRELKAKAAAIYQSYTPWRNALVGDGKPGAVALLRSWLIPPLVSVPQPCQPCQPPQEAVMIGVASADKLVVARPCRSLNREPCLPLLKRIRGR